MKYLFMGFFMTFFAKLALASSIIGFFGCSTPATPPPSTITITGSYSLSGVYNFAASFTGTPANLAAVFGAGAGVYEVSSFNDATYSGSPEVLAAQTGRGLTYHYHVTSGYPDNQEMVSTINTWLAANAPSITNNGFTTNGDDFLYYHPDIVILLTQ